MRLANVRSRRDGRRYLDETTLVFRTSNGAAAPPPDTEKKKKKRPTMSGGLDQLPTEVLCHILTFGAASAIVRLGTVARVFVEPARCPRLWLSLYERDFGSREPPDEHQDFARHGKDFRWLYFLEAVRQCATVAQGAAELLKSIMRKAVASSSGRTLYFVRSAKNRSCRSGEFALFMAENGDGMMTAQLMLDGYGAYVRTNETGDKRVMVVEGMWREGEFVGPGRTWHSDHRVARCEAFSPCDIEKRTVPPWENGWGEFHTRDGHIFHGDFEVGERTGYGTYQWPSGVIRAGEWLKDNIHGRCTVYEKDGACFTGQYVNDRIDGYGVKRTADGRLIESRWNTCAWSVTRRGTLSSSIAVVRKSCDAHSINALGTTESGQRFTVRFYDGGPYVRVDRVGPGPTVIVGTPDALCLVALSDDCADARLAGRCLYTPFDVHGASYDSSTPQVDASTVAPTMKAALARSLAFFGGSPPFTTTRPEGGATLDTLDATRLDGTAHAIWEREFDRIAAKVNDHENNGNVAPLVSTTTRTTWASMVHDKKDCNWNEWAEQEIKVLDATYDDLVASLNSARAGAVATSAPVCDLIMQDDERPYPCQVRDLDGRREPGDEPPRKKQARTVEDSDVASFRPLATLRDGQTTLGEKHDGENGIGMGHPFGRLLGTGDRVRCFLSGRLVDVRRCHFNSTGRLYARDLLHRWHHMPAPYAHDDPETGETLPLSYFFLPWYEWMREVASDTMQWAVCTVVDVLRSAHWIVAIGYVRIRLDLVRDMARAFALSRTPLLHQRRQQRTLDTVVLPLIAETLTAAAVAALDSNVKGGPLGSDTNDRGINVAHVCDAPLVRGFDLVSLSHIEFRHPQWDPRGPWRLGPPHRPCEMVDTTYDDDYERADDAHGSIAFAKTHGVIKVALVAPSFMHAHLEDVFFFGHLFEGASFAHARLDRCVFVGCTFKHCFMYGATLTRCGFNDCHYIDSVTNVTMALTHARARISAHGFL